MTVLHKTLALSLSILIVDLLIQHVSTTPTYPQNQTDPLPPISLINDLNASTIASIEKLLLTIPTTTTAAMNIDLSLMVTTTEAPATLKAEQPIVDVSTDKTTTTGDPKELLIPPASVNASIAQMFNTSHKTGQIIIRLVWFFFSRWKFNKI